MHDVMTTERLRLRRFTAEDVDNIYSMVSDPEVMRYYPGVRDYDGARKWLDFTLAGYDLNGYSFFAVERNHDGAFVGQVGLLHWDDVDGRPDVEVAYMLKRAHWGHGYASEAARASISWAFENLESDRVVSFIDVQNAPSIAVAERNGMKRLKQLDENRFGKPIYVYAVYSEEFVAYDDPE
jgi:RimJ/RimL family protein N-acetyltransferase